MVCGLVCRSGWRVGFNSLCALASVNHLHLHAWYLNERLFTEAAVRMFTVDACAQKILRR